MPEDSDRAERQALHDRLTSHCAAFVGLPVDDARNLARERGVFLRVIVEDEDGWYTRDQRNDRITAYARGGVVTRALVV